MKNVLLTGLMILIYHFAFSQVNISGKITDNNNQVLVGASIFMPDINKGTISNNEGYYELENIPKGKYKIQFKLIGFSSHILTINTAEDDLEINVNLNESPIEMEELVVTGGYNSTQHENAVKIDILKLDPRNIQNTTNFMELIAEIPGVDMISKGSGVSKPVIRGLSMNDVLVLNNGVRFENYQYSSHHPLGIDEFGISDVEIIKGPASLLYGSDAIGGVINFIKEKPAPVGSLSGDYNLQLFSNSLGMTNNLGIKASGNKVFGGIRIGQKTNADYLQGGGEFVPNSRFNEMSLKANAGLTNKIGSFKIFYDYNNQKLGLVEDHALEDITERGRKNEIFYQHLNTHLLSLQNKLFFNNYKLDLNAAYQSTELSHIGEENEYELQMQLQTITYEAKVYLPSTDKSDYILGIQGYNQKNTNLNSRETILLPDALTNNYSIFALIQYTFFEKLKVQGGLRYDLKEIASEAVGQPTEPLDYRKALDKSYGSFSGSLGATYDLTESLLFRTNFGAAYRTPRLAELTSKGQHELRFELGDENLVPENSYETDFSFHYHKSNITLDLAVFYNRINDFIFISPTGDTTNDGLSIYKYKQADSKLYGGEAGIHFHPQSMKYLHLETTFSTVIGVQDNGDYLPFIPANKLRFSLRLEKEKLSFLYKSYVALNTLTAFAQNNPAPDETATDSYTLLNINLGTTFIINKQPLLFSFGISNLLDTKYIDHLSTLKEVNFYNPGRNVSISLRVPFGNS
ncbi:MAG: hypothetical protein C0598_09780 [Marinilabiliales bacterium]|nr:MAG: hypothetical protein C0598_09780 [Marinilabiliales bacterium]